MLCLKIRPIFETVSEELTIGTTFAEGVVFGLSLFRGLACNSLWLACKFNKSVLQLEFSDSRIQASSRFFSEFLIF